MNGDPYRILGVSRSADPAEWKRAYRRLAMRWHPDRNDHPEATERFKEIRAAYDFLSARESDEATADAGPPEPAAERPARAADIRLNLRIDLEAAAAGCRKDLHYVRGKPCRTCQGSGEAGIARSSFCEACHGSGRVSDARQGLRACPTCGGRGFFTRRTCRDCGGSGRDAADARLEVAVPPGMLPGDELRLAGQGEPGDGTLQAGDLYLTIVIDSHPLFRLEGRDICYGMPVSFLDLLAGGRIELPSLGGMLRQELAAGSPAERELRLPGQGYPGRGNTPAGDLRVRLQPVFPQSLDARQRKLLLQANAALLAGAGEALPEIAAWRAANGIG